MSRGKTAPEPGNVLPMVIIAYAESCAELSVGIVQMTQGPSDTENVMLAGKGVTLAGNNGR